MASDRGRLMKFDLGKEGLETVFQPWQVELMRWVWGVNGEFGSRAAHVHLLGSSTPVSRAAVIIFLNVMVEEGFIVYREATAKGGWKRLYRASPEAQDEEAFRRVLAYRIIDKARTELTSDAFGGDS